MFVYIYIFLKNRLRKKYSLKRNVHIGQPKSSWVEWCKYGHTEFSPSYLLETMGTFKRTGSYGLTSIGSGITIGSSGLTSIGSGLTSTDSSGLTSIGSTSSSDV